MEKNCFKCDLWWPSVTLDVGCEVKMKDGDKAFAGLSLARDRFRAVSEGRALTDEVTLRGCNGERSRGRMFLPAHKRSRNTNVSCFKLLHSCSNSTSSAHAKQEHCMQVWQAQAPNNTTCSLCHCFHFSFRSLTPSCEPV